MTIVHPRQVSQVILPEGDARMQYYLSMVNESSYLRVNESSHYPHTRADIVLLY